MYKTLFRQISVLLAMGSFFLASPLEAEAIRFDEKTVIVRQGDHKLTREQQHEFRKWQAKAKNRRDNQGYFGAFVIEKESSRVSFNDNWNDLSAVRQHSLFFCRARAKNQDNCVLYASKLPGNLPIDSNDAFGLPTRLWPAYRVFSNNKLQKGEYSAFAVGYAYGAGGSVGKDNAREANSAAIEQCEKALSVYYGKRSGTAKSGNAAALERQMLEFERNVRANLKKLGFYRCKIVETRYGG